MKYLGWIQAGNSATPLTHDAWMECIASADDLLRPPGRPGRNPADGEPIVLRPPADTVSLIVDGEDLGMFSWSHSESPCINVESSQIDSDAVIQRATQIAKSIGATFTEYRGEGD